MSRHSWHYLSVCAPTESLGKLRKEHLCRVIGDNVDGWRARYCCGVLLLAVLIRINLNKRRADTLFEYRISNSMVL